MSEKTDKALVEETIHRRIEGIRRKDPAVISSVIKAEVYTKFDDWIGKLQQGLDALKEEEVALKVLSKYSYNITNLMVKVSGVFAWASFYLDYEGIIRNSIFNVQSRVSMVLVKEAEGWKIVHEHFSVMPKEFPIQPVPEEEKPAKIKVEKEDLGRLGEVVLSVLKDGSEKSAIEIAEKILVLDGKPVETSDVVETCHKLVRMNLIEQTRGGLHPKYRMKSTE